jgi:tetratricopeptide (TPR) repeat protein
MMGGNIWVKSEYGKGSSVFFTIKYLRGRTKRLQAIYQARNAEHMMAMLNQAREDYLRAVSISPDDRELLAELATAQMDCGQSEQALATWQTVQNMYSQGGEPTEVLIGKTEVLLALQRFEEANASLAALQQRGLDNSEAGRRLHAMMAASQENRRQ